LPIEQEWSRYCALPLPECAILNVIRSIDNIKNKNELDVGRVLLRRAQYFHRM
jgi:hypothetical protein